MYLFQKYKNNQHLNNNSKQKQLVSSVNQLKVLKPTCSVVVFSCTDASGFLEGGDLTRIK